MTTTGGPEQSFADPATSNTSADDAITIERVADGDDIVVEPDPPPLSPRRDRRVIVGAIVAVLLAGGVFAAIATRHHSHASNSNALRSLGPASPPAAHPTPAGRVVKPNRHPVPAPAHPKPPTAKLPTPVVISPPVSAATPPPTTPAVSPPPPVTAPPVATPPVEPTSVLRWTATPAALTVKGGAPAGVTITVENPTKGTVTLGTPLGCAPLLRGPHGAVIGATVCEQMAQLLAPHSKLTQHFTIYATDTAAAGGQALQPGVYTASFENLFKIKVNVTKS